SMLLLPILLAASCWFSSARANPVSVTKPESKTVLITCHVSVPDFDKAFIHWYRTRPGAAPERVAYMASTLFLANREDEGKFSIEKDVGKSLCTLTVTKVTLRDAGTYYCARWDAQQQRAIGSLHKDVLRFLDHTLKCPKPQETCPPCLPISPKPIEHTSQAAGHQRRCRAGAGCPDALCGWHQQRSRFTSRQPSLTKRTSSTAVIDCKVEGIDDFQGAYIHWYRHIPSRAPERLLYVTSTAQISYDKDSYKDKYHSSKRGKNTCTLSVKDIREDDEGTYYCAYWQSHRARRS
uniref:Ig-like domain-containing protein n=1 Tax=Anas zonorhyncha TaxID=75864 RepID=A0A8B9ZMZ5_9AVES